MDPVTTAMQCESMTIHNTIRDVFKFLKHEN